MVVRVLSDRDSANKYGWVIVLLVVSYGVTVVASGSGGIAVVLLIQLITLWLTFAASESPTAQRIAGIGCLVVGLAEIGTWVLGKQFEWEQPAERILAVGSVALYLIAPAVILRHLIRRAQVDGRTILGAIAVYIMLGMMFAFSYRAISLFQTQPAFFGDAGPGSNADFLFFSFITLTTTGYGDLVPAGNPGQSLAVMEAIIGQLFLVTALAKIVNAWRMPGAPTAPPPRT
jgi:hypothetical protein